MLPDNIVEAAQTECTNPITFALKEDGTLPFYVDFS